MGFFIAGGIFILFGGCFALKNWHRSKTWLHAPALGQIRKTYVHRGLQGEKSLRDQVWYRFTDSRGRMHSFDINDDSGLRDKELDAHVFYDPDNPKNVLIDNARDMYGLGLSLIVFGLWLLIFGYLATK